MSSLYVPNVRKIAILRANALGDFIVTLPAISALRAAYPDAEIILLGRPWHQAFLQKRRTPVDRVVVVPVMKGIREEAGQAENDQELESFFSAMQAEKIDIALGFHGRGVAANPLLKKLGARLTAGLTSPEAAPLDRSLLFDYYQSEVVRYLEVAALVGAVPVTLDAEVTVLPEDEKEVGQFLQALPDFKKETPYVVLHPCAVDVRRMWPAQQFALAGDALAEKGYQIFFTGSSADQPIIDAVTEQMNARVFSAAGRLSLGGLTALLAQSALVIASDTGPLHLARATGTKTIGIHWAPNLINWGPVTRTRNRAAVSWTMECPICGLVPNNPYPFEPQQNGCSHLVSFVRDVSVEEVLLQAEALLTNCQSSDQKTTFLEHLQYENIRKQEILKSNNKVN